MDEAPHIEEEKKNKNKKKRERKDQPEHVPGLIYISRIPGTMGPSEIRRYFTDFGEVNRMFLRPESEKLRQKRKKAGANVSKLKFVEGWVEFTRKKKAKKAALMLNSQPVGGPLNCKWRDELWNIRYLRGFQWEHLKEEKVFQKQFHQRAVRTELAAAKADTQKYLDNVQRAKRKDRARDDGDGDNNDAAAEAAVEPAKRRERVIKQRTLQEAPSDAGLPQEFLQTVMGVD